MRIHMYMCVCMSCMCISRGKHAVTCRCKAKLHQGQHTLKSLRPMDHNGLASKAISSRTCTLLTAGLSKLLPQKMQRQEKDVVLCMEQGKRNTDLGEEKGKARLQKESACTRLGRSTLKRGSFRCRAMSVPHNATSVSLSKHYEFISAPWSLTRSLCCFQVPASPPAWLCMVLPLPPHLPPHTLSRYLLAKIFTAAPNFGPG